MSNKKHITVDGNEAAASVAFRVSEAIAIFPITPSSTMAELCDEWAGRGKTKLDEEANSGKGPRISRPESKVSVWVIPTNEELMVARHTGSLLGLTR